MSTPEPLAPGRGRAEAATRACSVLILTVVVVGLGMIVLKVTRLPFTGDEPGYLIQSESLWNDHDVDMSNNVGSATRLRALTPDTDSEALEVGTSLVPVQPPGLPLILAPAVALARSASMEVTLARLTIAAFAVATFALILLTLIAVRPDEPWFALLLVVATAISLAGAPWIVLLYPEMVAAFCVALALHAVVTSHRGGLLAQCAAVALLPWLSIRLSVIAAVLVLLSLRQGRARLAVLGACLGLSLAGLALYSKASYGLWNPAAVYSAYTHGYRPTLITRYRVGLGSLFSRNEGLFVVLPLTWLAAFGMGRVLRRHLIEGAACLALVAAYVVAVLPSGARGTAPPPRLVVVLVPMVVVAAWVGFSRHRLWLACFAAASILGMAASLPYLRSPGESLRLFGDAEAIRVSGTIPIYPRVHAALGAEGLSQLPALADGSTTTWGPFQVVGGDWNVRAFEGGQLPVGLMIESASSRSGSYRQLLSHPADSPGSLSVAVPGYESWLRAWSVQGQSTDPLEFQAIRPRTRERVALSQVWKSAVLVALGAVLLGAGYLFPGRGSRSAS